NVIAVGGTNVPKTVLNLTKERITTAFVDGDRGGELILKELLQTADVDFVARAPQTREVEEIPQKLIMKALKNKIPSEQYAEMYDIKLDRPKDDFFDILVVCNIQESLGNDTVKYYSRNIVTLLECISQLSHRYFLHFFVVLIKQHCF
ncbi:unnamed protein product, partial [marine sediment metagenome]